MIVPSPPRRTFWLSFAAMLPVVVACCLLVHQREAPATVAVPAIQDAVVVLYGACTVVFATIASSVIFSLRRRVRAARQLGQYTLEEKVGQGGMGVVYRARHLMLKRPTAVKLLRPDKSTERSIARFEREVQLTSRLTHPNTVEIYDYGRTPDNIFYYAMEFLPGITVGRLVQDHGIQPAGRTIHILQQVVASLSEAHAMGVIHRDIKPDNLILCERGGIHDVVKVVDFGLVREIERTDVLDPAGPNFIVGTPNYLSPEAIEGPSGIDGRSDLYAVGAVGYVLVTGMRPFEGTTTAEIIDNQLNTSPQSPSARLGREVPPDLEKVIMDCMERNPAARPPTAGALLERLDACDEAGSWSQKEAREWWQRHMGRDALSPEQRFLEELYQSGTITIRLPESSDAD
jgi:serine/threonine-protein kinase